MRARRRRRQHLIALRALAATALCAALVYAIAYASQVPFRVERGGEAAIRFSWRAVGKPVEACRTPSAEEQAALPVHMRQTRICERRLAPFHLAVTLDGASAIDERIEPKGAEHDRPSYVLRELRVAPGSHRLAVRFTPETEGATPLALDAELSLAAGEVALVTESEGGELELRREAAP